MGDLPQRRRASLLWVGELPDPFTLDDMLRRVPAGDVSSALSWLFAAIERGRVVPVEDESRRCYRFDAGRRRDADLPRFVRTAGRV